MREKSALLKFSSILGRLREALRSACGRQAFARRHDAE